MHSFIFSYYYPPSYYGITPSPNNGPPPLSPQLSSQLGILAKIGQYALILFIILAIVIFIVLIVYLCYFLITKCCRNAENDKEEFKNTDNVDGYIPNVPENEPIYDRPPEIVELYPPRVNLVSTRTGRSFSVDNSENQTPRIVEIEPSRNSVTSNRVGKTLTSQRSLSSFDLSPDPHNYETREAIRVVSPVHV